MWYAWISDRHGNEAGYCFTHRGGGGGGWNLKGRGRPDMWPAMMEQEHDYEEAGPGIAGEKTTMSVAARSEQHIMEVSMS